MTAATLFIVPTPIGNLQDITQRAIDVLSSVAWIAAEDTRHSQKLLQHLAIQARTLSLHDHNEEKRTQMLCNKLQAGESVALISDAGTPLISDPGFVLVRSCREQGINVVALPGPCAAITALSASGLATDRFIFEGFLPAKTQARMNVLETLLERTCTSVFYEAPRRILDTVNDVKTVLGDGRQLVLAKELTKTFETYISDTPDGVIAWLQADPVHQKGEFVLMVAGAPPRSDEMPAEAMALLKRLKQDLPLKKAAAIVADHYQLKKNALYQAGLALE
ncbi:16S rRNA (cytidine(1402)-2'-O)-methyltransferase [Alteromonas lipolytica]|uniref:Ribosomal RNA small subunit methyltransferase I n=1 Tax=Alteromonas lipolytica TaxID=1856405 RepID=A0A1E8FB39_9ALTE|nr:16S rRNA (cytidine(1402)-2'-O)-methyltransferase [Alteromonas lipolytica]OFI32713.1 16S rRNA (cytidine(1402)-2'-O)-methyltransferase [Alteromonas lipolytica]GGF73814.1 ribosomal RNA small subunit methyltransferase I [Alteromonas lipolytica]